MKKLMSCIALLCFTSTAAVSSPNPTAHSRSLRPPAVPLVTSDPYLSIWSESDQLSGGATRHWTGRPHPLVSLIRIDGKVLRLMGNVPADGPAMPQVALGVLPTRSIYDFDDSHVHVTLTFMTPALPDDLEVLARPLTYLTWQVKSIDGKSHDISIYHSTSGLLTVNTPNQPVQWNREKAGPLTALRIGTVSQTLLQPAGDDARIDWGYAYAAALSSQASAAIGASDAMIQSFVERGKLPSDDDGRMPRAANDTEPVLAFAFDLAAVGDRAVARHLLIAYDEIYAINYFGQKLPPYWRKDGATASDLLQSAERDYESLARRCEAFDAELMADLAKQGGQRYAEIAAAAYRQALAGVGLAADANKQPLLFTKENTSNGCIATVDVIYPAAPQFLLMGPAYAKALVAPAMVYGASERWKFPFAPHDLGVYPQAKGQVYGGGESPGNEADKMPVEESGNLILLCDAIARMDGNADFVAPWWPQLTQWEGYLEKFGLDPENQLCTDDFMGHLAHNANLSVKAILAIAAYGDLCKMRGDAAGAEKYFALARTDAKHWMEAAADGDHYRIAFDKPNTWSQKYNLVWDSILGLNVFPPEVAQKEVAYYQKVMQRYGVPLDSRTKLTKSDWCLWSATLASRQADFETMVSPIYDYLNATPTHVPMVDSYITDKLDSNGMHARPVVGGIFIKMLTDPAMWKKWSSRDKTKIGTFASIPPPPKISEIVPTSERQPVKWKYTTEKPAGDWTRSGFDDSSWKEGPGGFGSPGTPGLVMGTPWRSADIWLRREATIPDGRFANPQLLLYHDEDAEVYFDGLLAASEGGYVNHYEPIEVRPEAKALLKAGKKVTLAVHCHQTTGGQGIDVGIVDVVEQPAELKR